MKTLNLTTLIILGCLFLSCSPKTEKTRPIPEPQYINNTQNYKLDDDELLRRKRKNSLIKAQPLKTKLKKSSATTN
ncbi:hypothetical protein [Flavobacterium nackdongense]|uniref:Lipoprotein n=1 Tax=Flavobacterium nackdongense TaxID=2547394 RepID=A0A4P6Y9J3_9FLAO|nr:hypothetical protein [Flavobacterium nackdongense]QBN19659.1 hypothetical protein E1750_12885 [Flavobacterium nackdongense]